MANTTGLGGLYVKEMQYFGCGVAMFQPVSGMDLRPPCAGYIDNAGKWNIVADICWIQANGQIHWNKGRESPVAGIRYRPLDSAPVKMEQLGIEWRPRTSIGVKQWNVDLSGKTPDVGIPVGADAHVKYKSDKNFGAILIARKPITLTTYNDETLFRSWLYHNKALLSALHGPQLRRYGLWLVTTTYTAQKCSINAWMDKDKEATISVKVKASMAGDLGENLDWSDQLADRDWSHYVGNEQGDGIVLFFNGIEIPAWEWWWEGVKCSLGNGGQVRRNNLEGLAGRRRHECGVSLLRREGLLSEDNRPRSSEVSPLRAQCASSGRQKQNHIFTGGLQRGISTSTPTRLSKYLDNEDQKPLSTKPLATTRANRFNSASTTTSSSILQTRDPRTSSFEASLATPQYTLRRKTSSPSLRRSTYSE